MAFSNYKFAMIAIFAMCLAFTSCSNKSNNSNNSAKTEQAEKGKEYTSAYICPMHCEGSGSDKAGKCPVCGMDYVKNETHTFACSMHPEITGMKGDKCSKCGMNLTPISGDDHADHNH